MPLTTTQRLSVFVFALAILMCGASYAGAQAGSLDPTFGTNGIVSASMHVSAVAIQKNGKIVLAGSAVVKDQFFDALLRLNADGSYDKTFGTGGFAYLTPPTAEYVPFGFLAMAIQSNGEIIVAGETQTFSNGTYINFVQVARVESNGTLDSSFGPGGFTTSTALVFTPYNITAAEGAALALQSDDSVLVASSYSNLMARFTSSGQLDTTFGTAGLVNLANPGPNVTSAPSQIAVQGNGKILVASGSIAPTPLPQAGTISRYNTNGSLDATFGAAGSTASLASASALSLQGDGKIVVAGTLTSQLNAPPAGNGAGFGVARYTSTGAADKTFGSGGVAVANFGAAYPLSGAFAIAIQSNGEPVAAGAAAQGPLNLSFNSAFGLARFTTAGALDSSFGTGGLVTTILLTGGTDTSVFSYVDGLAIQSDGKIVAAGNTSVDQGFGSGTGAYIARYLSQ